MAIRGEDIESFFVNRKNFIKTYKTDDNKYFILGRKRIFAYDLNEHKLLDFDYTVHGNFCPNFTVSTLHGGPKIVEGHCIIHGNKYLKSLKGGPKIVGGDFDCNRSENLLSMEGSPEEFQKFNCNFPEDIIIPEYLNKYNKWYYNSKLVRIYK